MEGLHIAIEDSKLVNLFLGAKVGKSSLIISHLFYADDVITLGEWVIGNICNIVRVLLCFFWFWG